MLSYGNTGTPVTMNKGGFKIQYREPLAGGNRVFLSCRTATVMDAVAEFNLIKGGFDTPLRIERFDVFGILLIPTLWTAVMAFRGDSSNGPYY